MDSLPTNEASPRSYQPEVDMKADGSPLLLY